MIDRNPEGVLFLRSGLLSLSEGDSLNRTSKAVYRRISTTPGFVSKEVDAAPDILLFERHGTSKWRIRSAIFRNLAVVSSDADGRFHWKVHPAQRAGGDPTILEYLDPVPADAELIGSVRKADSRCAGVEFVVQSVENPAQQEVLDIASPVEGKPFSIQLHNKSPENVVVRIQSSDPSDNIDFCWLEIDGVEIRALQATRRSQAAPYPDKSK